ncbi:MAG: dTDP-glucose 4,6-dehydratase [Candidatus Omnitrophota bacterium]
MTSLLVTGGAGFIGSNFIQYMLSAYEDVHIINLDKLTYAGNLENLRAIERDPRYCFFQGDIADKQLVMDLLSRKEVNAIVNFAAETHVDRSISRPDDFLKTDVIGTFNLLEAARQCKVERFVQISTDEVYGPVFAEPMKEDSPMRPSSPYSASKGGGELLCRAYCVTYGLSAIVTRAANNYGPYQYPEKLIPLFITNAMENEPLPVYGKGDQMREWLYVEDHCRAIDLVLKNGVAGEIYNVGGYAEERNIAVAEKILELMKKPKDLLSFVEDRPGHDFRYAIDSGKIKALGWEPAVSLEEGLAKTVSWYKKNKEWWKKIKGPEFKAYYKKQYGGRLKPPGGGQ